MVVGLVFELFDSRGFTELLFELDRLFGELKDEGLENFCGGLYVSVLFGDAFLSLVDGQFGNLIDALGLLLELTEDRIFDHLCHEIHFFLCIFYYYDEKEDLRKRKLELIIECVLIFFRKIGNSWKWCNGKT